MEEREGWQGVPELKNSGELRGDQNSQQEGAAGHLASPQLWRGEASPTSLCLPALKRDPSYLGLLAVCWAGLLSPQGLLGYRCGMSET